MRAFTGRQPYTFVCCHGLIEKQIMWCNAHANAHAIDCAQAMQSLGMSIKAEEHRAHDPLVHHWLVSMGFQALLTDFCAPVPGTALASSTTLPPPELVDFRDAKRAWEDYFRGHLSLQDLMRRYGRKLVLVAPDRTEYIPRLISKVQRDLFALNMEPDEAMNMCCVLMCVL